MVKIQYAALIAIMLLPATLWASSHFEDGVGEVESQEFAVGHFYVEHYETVKGRAVHNKFSLFYDTGIAGALNRNEIAAEKFADENSVCRKYGYPRGAVPHRVLMTFSEIGSGADVGDALLHPFESQVRHEISNRIFFRCRK